MKYLFVFLLLGLMVSCGDSTGDASTEKKADATVKYVTVKIGNLEIMTEDLGEMNWDEANKACSALGDGWRLPTKDELNILYKNKEKTGGFAKSTYWSSTEFDNFNAWKQFFNNGFQFYNGKNSNYYVRAVRTF